MIELPSLNVPEAEKRAFSEADVHSKLFEPDMAALGYPPRTNTQADGEHFREQRMLAARRLRSRRERGQYDGLYLIGNAPVVLCELKRFGAIDSDHEFSRAVKQLHDYARSEDFETPPPFLLLYSGQPERTRFYRRIEMADPASSAGPTYEELPEIWAWQRVKDAHVKGAFAEEVVDADRLRDILIDHLDRIEDDLRPTVKTAVELVRRPVEERPSLLSEFQKWLVGHPEAERQMRALYDRKVAEIGETKTEAVAEEMVTQAALNYLNKVFFLNLCEDRNLPGFYRIMREFLPETKAETTSTAATIFLGLLRRRILNSAQVWDPEEERVYQELRGELTSDIRDHVIEQNNWWELIRVAFDLAEERFPLVYREDAFDHFRPGKDTLAELVYDLSTKSFRALTNRHVGDIYQALLASKRRGSPDAGGRRRQRAKLGAFYTPRADVDYMVSRLGLEKQSRVLDPCMGSGHFLESLYKHLARLYEAEGHTREAAYAEIVGSQLFGADIDGFATSLAAIRLFLLDEHATRTPPNLFVHDMLLHSPERPGSELFSAELHAESGALKQGAEQRAVAIDPGVDAIGPIDHIEFDAVIGNPPYGARKPAYKKDAYARLYGQRQQDLNAGSVGTGDGDSYAMFFANGIERLREGGRLCLISNDSFRSLTTHAALRRHILDRCKIVEILLTDTKHFEGVTFQFAGMAITTLEKCSDSDARAANVMRLVDYLRDRAEFADPPSDRVGELRQVEYETLPETPFFVGIPAEIVAAAKGSGTVSDVARGRQGLATADDKRFLAGIGEPVRGLEKVVSHEDLAGQIDADARAVGLPPSVPHWVPFAKGGGYGEYWAVPEVAIDWSSDSVAELERRDKLPPGTPRRPRFQNRDYYFRPGLTYSVISSGRISVRLLPEGWIFGHKGSAIFVDDSETSELFLLGYLNSALATYFMKRIVNTTATADIGYIEKLPYRKPSKEIEQLVTDRVEQIIAAAKNDPEADVGELRAEIDEAIFELFEIRSTREEVRRFHLTVGRIERADDEAGSAEAQMATE